MKERCPALHAGHSVKAMRGRIALIEHLVRNPCEALFCFVSFRRARASSRRFYNDILGTDAVLFGGSQTFSLQPFF
jgi:hypothetical protein